MGFAKHLSRKGNSQKHKHKETMPRHSKLSIDILEKYIVAIPQTIPKASVCLFGTMPTNQDYPS